MPSLMSANSVHISFIDLFTEGLSEMFLYFVIPCTIDAPVRVPHISPVPATPVPNPDVILEAISSFNPVTSVNTRATHWEQL